MKFAEVQQETWMDKLSSIFIGMFLIPVGLVSTIVVVALAFALEALPMVIGLGVLYLFYRLVFG